MFIQQIASLWVSILNNYLITKLIDNCFNNQLFTINSIKSFSPKKQISLLTSWNLDIYAEVPHLGLCFWQIMGMVGDGPVRAADCSLISSVIFDIFIYFLVKFFFYFKVIPYRCSMCMLEEVLTKSKININMSLRTPSSFSL